MLKERRKRKSALALFLIFALAGGAIAYWVAGGSGTGEAEAGSTVELTVVQTTVLDPMYPGDSPQTISGTFNNTNDGSIYVGTVTASIDSVTPAGTGTCTAGDFTLTDVTDTVNAEVPSGTGVGAWSGPKIQFNNKADVDQGGCKGAAVTLGYEIG